MGKKPSVAQGVMVVEVPMGVGLDGEPDKCQGIIGYRHVAVRKAEFALPDGLYFSAYQCDTALQVFDYLVIEVGFSILLQKFYLVLILFHLVYPGYAKPN